MTKSTAAWFELTSPQEDGATNVQVQALRVATSLLTTVVSADRHRGNQLNGVAFQSEFVWLVLDEMIPLNARNSMSLRDGIKERREGGDIDIHST